MKVTEIECGKIYRSKSETYYKIDKQNKLKRFSLLRNKWEEYDDYYSTIMRIELEETSNVIDWDKVPSGTPIIAWDFDPDNSKVYYFVKYDYKYKFIVSRVNVVDGLTGFDYRNSNLCFKNAELHESVEVNPMWLKEE